MEMRAFIFKVKATSRWADCSRTTRGTQFTWPERGGWWTARGVPDWWRTRRHSSRNWTSTFFWPIRTNSSTPTFLTMRFFFLPLFFLWSGSKHRFFLQSENNYEHWQLLEDPVTFDSFNALPMLTGMFFEYSLRLDPELELPIVIIDQCEVNIWAWEPIKYRYKFFPVNKVRKAPFFNLHNPCVPLWKWPKNALLFVPTIPWRILGMVGFELQLNSSSK